MINKEIKNKIDKKELDKEICEEALKRYAELGLDKENAFEHADHFEGETESYSGESGWFVFWSENYDYEREHRASLPERAIYDESWWKEKEVEAEEKRIREETEKAKAKIAEKERSVKEEQKRIGGVLKA